MSHFTIASGKGVEWFEHTKLFAIQGICDYKSYNKFTVDNTTSRWPDLFDDLFGSVTNLLDKFFEVTDDEVDSMDTARQNNFVKCLRLTRLAMARVRLAESALRPGKLGLPPFNTLSLIIGSVSKLVLAKHLQCELGPNASIQTQQLNLKWTPKPALDTLHGLELPSSRRQLCGRTY